MFSKQELASRSSQRNRKNVHAKYQVGLYQCEKVQKPIKAHKVAKISAGEIVLGTRMWSWVTSLTSLFWARAMLKTVNTILAETNLLRQS